MFGLRPDTPACVAASAGKPTDEGGKRKRPANGPTLSPNGGIKKAPGNRSSTGREVIKPTTHGEDSSDKEGGKEDPASVVRDHTRARHDGLLARLGRSEVGLVIRRLRCDAIKGSNGSVYVKVACKEPSDLLLLNVYGRCLPPQRGQQDNPQDQAELGSFIV